MKKLVMTLCVIAYLVLVSTPVSAVCLGCLPSPSNSPITTGSSITPRIDVTGYVYRSNNGVPEKRLWSYTRGVWIDADWTKA